MRSRIVRRHLFGITLLAATLVPDPLMACLAEEVILPTIKVKHFKGRFLEADRYLEELIQSANFTMREVAADESESVPFQVQVEGDGSFEMDLPPGTYRYSVHFDSFFFTLTGKIEISDSATLEEILFDPPWC